MQENWFGTGKFENQRLISQPEEQNSKIITVHEMSIKPQKLFLLKVIFPFKIYF